MKAESVGSKELQDLPKIAFDAGKVLKGGKVDAHKMEELLQEGRLDTKKLAEDAEKISPEKFDEFMDALNKFMIAFDQKMRFRVYKDTNTLWVRIMDATTDEVLREIPSREALELASKIKDFVGLFIDRKV